MEELLQRLSLIKPLSEACLDYLRTILRYGTIKKGQMLLDEGEVCENMYFIREGILRSYYLEGDEQVADWFFCKNDMMIEIEGFCGHAPSASYIDAMEDCAFFYIPQSQLNGLFEGFLEFNAVALYLNTRYLGLRLEHERILHMGSDQEKYRFLHHRMRKVVRRVPGDVLASFLDMAPETLNRLLTKFPI